MLHENKLSIMLISLAEVLKEWANRYTNISYDIDAEWKDLICFSRAFIFDGRDAAVVYEDGSGSKWGQNKVYVNDN